MKNLFFICVIGGVMLIASRSDSTKLRSFIPGTYVAAYEHEYAKGWDTIVITSFNENAYSITRRTGFHAIREDRLLPMQQSLRRYTGVFDPQRETVIEKGRGITLRFDPARNRMRWGNTEYRRIQ